MYDNFEELKTRAEAAEARVKELESKILEYVEHDPAWYDLSFEENAIRMDKREKEQSARIQELKARVAELEAALIDRSPAYEVLMAVQAERDRLRAALDALKRGGCFCQSGIDNPMMQGKHTTICLNAMAALAGEEVGHE